MVLALFGDLQLRKAVRHVSDAPNELIDERQIAVRNAACVGDYGWLAFVCFLVAVALIGTSSGGVLEGALDLAQREEFLNGLYMALMMTMPSIAPQCRSSHIGGAGSGPSAG